MAAAKPSTSTESMLPIAVDAMGGDHAPDEIIKGARTAAAELGVPILLVGRPDELTDVGDLEVLEASQVIAMDAEPGSSVRTMKDSSLVRAAEAVRDGRASAMVSAGNTGAAMGSALLRMGRIKGIARPAIATPIPTPGGLPTTMLDAGANSECKTEWLVQFARMGTVYARDRFGIERPRVGLLSIGEEAGKGNSFVKEVFGLRVPREWSRMGPDLQRAYAAKQAETRTARLEIRMESPGVFVVSSTDVKRFRLLLTREMIAPDGSVAVKFNKRRIKKRPKESKQVLLQEFAERFERTFLPTYEVVVP